jgi:hypothetical protein
MNHADYKKWLQKLIHNLESKSVIVVDNASYHNVQLNRHPTNNARKGEMLFWLDKHGIRYSFDMTKAELYDLIKMHTPQHGTFAIDFAGWTMHFLIMSKRPTNASLIQCIGA